MKAGSQENVWFDLDNAHENGAFDRRGFLRGATDQDIADDLIACSDYHGGLTAADLIPHVASWRDANQGKLQ